jgi:serine/threonine protein kinase
VSADLVGGKYELTRRIGAGGMGQVYEAIHATRGTRVALKIMHPHVALVGVDGDGRSKRDEIVGRFEREARSMAAIHSEHVVDVLDAGTDQDSGRPYIVMELLHGEDLESLAKRLGPIAPELSLRIAAQACLGLSAAHAAGVVHRDIKMANLYLAKKGDERVLKILDFGIAKIAMDQFHSAHDKGLTSTGNLLGSPQYMSPEQAQGLKTIDHRADIWSMGVVLYRCLTATTPFSGESLGQLILAVCSESPRPIEDAAPWISPGIAAIVHRALRRQPEDRFSSIDAMLAAIRQLSRGHTIEESAIMPLPEEHQAPRSEREPLERSGRRRIQGAPAVRSADGAGELTRRVPRPTKKTVLIMDDSQTVRSVLKVFLTGRELEFIEAGSGDEGLQLLRERSIDLVIADINMPKLDGIAFVRRLRATIGPSRHLPVIVITAEKSTEVRDQALAAGADEVLRKPVNSSGVVEAVDRLMRRQGVASR